MFSAETYELQRACVSGNIEDVKLLLESGYDPANALVIACAFSTPEIIQLLIDYGCDPKLQEKQCLENAVFKRKPKIVKLLLEKGCSAQNIDAITEASLRGYLEIVKILYEYKCNLNNEALYWAAWGNHTKIVKFLLNHGCWKPNIKKYIIKFIHKEIIKLKISQQFYPYEILEIIERSPYSKFFTSSQLFNFISFKK